jgi:hypothetical protein
MPEASEVVIFLHELSVELYGRRCVASECHGYSVDALDTQYYIHLLVLPQVFNGP